VLQSMDKDSLAQEVEDIKDMGFTALLGRCCINLAELVDFKMLQLHQIQ